MLKLYRAFLSISIMLIPVLAISTKNIQDDSLA
jgi:hypothetical protein